MQATDWFEVTTRDLPAGRLHLKPGVRGYPELPPGSEVLQKLDLSCAERLLDLSGCAGLGALLARSHQSGCQPVPEASAASLACARLTGPAVAGLPWDHTGQPADTTLLQPQPDRGNQRMFLEVQRVAARVGEGRLLLISQRDGGGKRLEKLAAGLFRSAEVIRRDKGYRVLKCRGALPQGELPAETVEFEAAGLQLEAIKGTFAAGKLDPGTAQLLEALGTPAWLAQRRVLDLGCGYGLLALQAALNGALVTAVDDDLAAVRSTAANAGRLGVSDSLTALHSDLDSALNGSQKFDTVLMNPPFHVGKGVRLDVSRAFVDTAWRRLVEGGTLWLVANRALPYERLLSGWREVATVRDEAGFKVLRARR